MNDLYDIMVYLIDTFMSFIVANEQATSRSHKVCRGKIISMLEHKHYGSDSHRCLCPFNTEYLSVQAKLAEIDTRFLSHLQSR